MKNLTWYELKKNIIDYIKFIFGSLIVVVIIYFGIFYNPDPFMYGCVYDKDYGTKISCVNVEFNEAKNPGSMDEAFQSCMAQLKRIGRKSGVSYEVDGCVDSEGPYN